MLPNSPGSSPLTRGKLAASEARALQIGLIPAHAGKTGRGCQRVANPAAHPRSRGENPHVVFEPSCCHGSSPLTRGKRTGQMFRSTCSRLIPAHAGKTSGRQSARGPQPAHPRSRGENRVIGSPLAILHGSSPLTRGKLKRVGVTLARDRLIPAHAGKTASWRWPSLPVKAHPRSRGENTTSRGSRPRRSGSSPLTRGKRPLRNVKSLQGRLIPAHAGKTATDR